MGKYKIVDLVPPYRIPYSNVQGYIAHKEQAPPLGTP